MNRIWRNEACRRSALALESSLRAGVAILANHAQRILARQDGDDKIPELIPGFTAALREGVRTLSQIADQPGNIVVVTEKEAHWAFVTCCVLASHVDELPPPGRRSLGQVLLIMADCFCVEVPVGTIPPFVSLSAHLRSHVIVGRLYPDIWAVRGQPGKKFALTLADALALVEALGTVSSPVPLVMLRFELWYLTGLFRMALSQVAGRKS